MEDEWSSNATSTASRLMFVYVLSSHYLPPSPSPPQFARNHTQSPGREPLPYSEGCGLNQYHLRSLRSEDVVAAAPPLFKGMWAACCRSTVECGRETRKGGPRKWEALHVRCDSELRFRRSSFSSFLSVLRTSDYFHTSLQSNDEE